MQSGCLLWLPEYCGLSFAALGSLFPSLSLASPPSFDLFASPRLERPPPLPNFTFLPPHSHAVLWAVGTVGTFIGVVVAAVDILGKVVGDMVAAEDGGRRGAQDLEILRAELSSNPSRRNHREQPFENTSDLATRMVVLSVCEDLRQRKDTESRKASVNTFEVLGCG